MEGELLRIGNGGVVPVRWEVAKAGADPGTLTGWASVYGNIDRQDEVVMPGAFKKSLAKWRAEKTTIPLTMDHDNGVKGVIGSLVDAVDKPFGLKTTFKFASTQDAQDARKKAIEGHVTGLSIFGFVKNNSIDMMDDKAVRILREVDLLSIGLTPIPANEKALATSVKNLQGLKVDDDIPLPDAWVADMRAAITITSVTARALAVKSLILDYVSTIGNEEVDEGTSDSDNSDDSTDESPDEQAAAKYALSIIGESEAKASPAGGPADLDDLTAYIDADDVNADLDALERELKS